ncbi:MAG: M24 family metallopeptidase [Gemmatimonadetes bacterium]|nr:M24 family metallopeptidase [Gemmatimonadota bacterium]
MPMENGGPHVSIVTAQVDGYGVELERTFFLGYVPEWAAAPFAAMLEARATAFAMALPGAILAEIDRAVRAVIARHGYGDCITIAQATASGSPATKALRGARR